MDDLTEIVNFDKIHSYQTNPYYKRIRFREESDLIHYREAEEIIDESANGFLEKELTKIRLNQLFAETKKSLERSIANAKEPQDYVNEKIERIKQSREAGNQYSRYNALPSGKKEKPKPVIKREVNPLMMKAKIYGKMVSNENRKKYEAQPKVYKPNLANVKRLMRLQKPRNRLNEYGHYYSIRNRLLYKEEIEEFDNEFTELLLECVLFEKDHLDVQGYLEEKLRLHQFEIPKCARKLGIGTETEIEIEKISNKSSNNELSSDNYGFDSNLDVPLASKKIPVKHNIAIKQQKPPKRNDSFVKNYYDLIEDDDVDIKSFDTNKLNKNNNKVIILKPDADSDEIMLGDMRTSDDEKAIDNNNGTNEINSSKVININISNLTSSYNTDNNSKIEEKSIVRNIDNINKNVINELESNSDGNEGAEKPRQWDVSKVQPIEKNYRVNIADIINEFNLKLKARNMNTINADNIPNNDNNNSNINNTKDVNVINKNTINTNYVPEPAESKADTSTTYYSTNSVGATPNNSNLLQEPKDLFEKIIKFNSVGVHTDNIHTSKSKHLPPINEEAENNDLSGLESISPTQSFMSLPPPPSEIELKLLEETFTARSRDISPSKPMEINCDDSKINVGMQTKEHVDKNFVKYMKADKPANDIDDIALENYSAENKPSGVVHQSLIEKFQNILKN